MLSNSGTDPGGSRGFFRMQPALLTARKIDRDNKKSEPASHQFDFERLIYRLSNGDVSKRESILYQLEANVAFRWLRLQEEERREKINQELMKMEFLARLLGSKWKAPYLNERLDSQGKIGGYCGGKDVEECRKIFGDRLAEICATCPE